MPTLAFEPEWREAANGWTFYVGGYETTDGRHFNMEAGDPPIEENQLHKCDYVSVHVYDPNGNDWGWVHVDGPFDDWIDVEYDVIDVLDEY